jgi:hypothetical protein
MQGGAKSSSQTILFGFQPRRCTTDCNGNCAPLGAEENAHNTHFKLVKLFHGREESDAVLRTSDGGIFRIHRAVLMAGSEYFRYYYIKCSFSIDN